jgi:predicted nucleic acid-binding protein
MIVVDCNVLAYFYIPSLKFNDAVHTLLEEDTDWIAPRLWRSEFRNILLKYVKSGSMTISRAQRIQSEAEELMLENEHDVDSDEVIELAAQSGCTAYDCEYIELAKRHGLKLVTADKKLIAAFPSITRSLL